MRVLEDTGLSETPMGVGKIAWVNGAFVAADEARISPFDRGFLFGDGVYEVVAVHGGRLIDMARHLDRLERSMRELGFGAAPDRGELEAMHRELVARNAIVEGLVYLQVTRGAYGGRDFVAPASPRLTVFAFAEAKQLLDTPAHRDGVKVMLTPDIRWARRDIKSVGLLAQALAKTAAKAEGKDDAWFVDGDGFVTEGASANAWIVTQAGDLVTRALSSEILAGVTRHAVMDLVAQGGGKVEQRPFSVEEAQVAQEAFATSAVALVTPVVELGGAQIGDGKPGPVTRRMQEMYRAAMAGG